MKYNDIIQRQDEIKPRLLELAERDEALEGDTAEEYTKLRDEFADLKRQAKDVEARQAEVVDYAQRTEEESSEDWIDSPPSDEKRSQRNPWELDAVSRAAASELRERALSAVELTAGADDQARAKLTDIVENFSDDDVDYGARLVLATTSPAYKRAFGKLVKHGEASGLNRLSEAEAGAVRYAEQIRAVTVGTDAQGGYLVPTDIEPVVTLADSGTNNPLYNLARRVQTMSDTYRVVTSTGAAWSWDAEVAEVSDDTPTYANTDIALYTGRGFVPVSIEAQASIQGAAANVSLALQDGWNDLIGNALTLGTGSSQPFGLVTALAGGGSEVASAATDTFAVADVYSVFDALPARHRRGSVWMSNVAIASSIRQFATDDGHALLARLGDGTDQTILGQRWVENEDMDSSVTATADNYVLLLVQPQHFVVAEGIGMTVEFLPHVFGSNGRPIGARGFFAYHRLGSDSVLDDGHRMLNVT